MATHNRRSVRFTESRVAKRSAIIAGHKTSMSMEQPFWDALKEIADANNLSLAALLTRINSTRQHPNLSSAIRLFVLNYYRERVEPGKRWLGETDD